MHSFTSLAYPSWEEMTFGNAPHPLKCGFDLAIGSGLVFPEVNYTLPPMQVALDNLEQILEEYRTMVRSVLSRLVTLKAPGVVLEFEHTPEMTEIVEIGEKITQLSREIMHEYHEKHGLSLALRVTVCDLREKGTPPRIRSGEFVQRVWEAFDRNAGAGADLLSIESVGGKEVSDRALVEGDLPGVLFALGVLAPRDMHYLWQKITSIARNHDVIPAGDTACGFGNTAMVLADQLYIPSVLAAVVRAMTSVRSLVAYEEGAVGPSKDCAYEGPVIKAITGYPISMEGKSSACAHFSHVGNIASAVCDLWSNESVQNVRLLSGFAPEVFAEILAYDCRLMNRALELGTNRELQNLMVSSDKYESVHALMISPDSAYRIAREIIGEVDDFRRTHRAATVACRILREALDDGRMSLPQREVKWLDTIEQGLESYSAEDKVIEYGLETYADVVIPGEYDL